MKWSVIRPKILSVLTTLSGIGTNWRDRERPFVAPGSEAICLLHSQGARGGPGDDDFRLEFNAGTNKLDITQAGIRLFTLSVLVESYNQADDKTALEYLEDIRDGLMRPQILADLRIDNLAIRDISETRDISPTEDDHLVSAASMDVFFAYGNNKVAADGAGLTALDWIEQVGGLETDSDNVTPVTAEIDGEIIPGVAISIGSYASV